MKMKHLPLICGLLLCGIMGLGSCSEVNDPAQEVQAPPPVVQVADHEPEAFEYIEPAGDLAEAMMEDFFESAWKEVSLSELPALFDTLPFMTVAEFQAHGIVYGQGTTRITFPDFHLDLKGGFEIDQSTYEDTVLLRVQGNGGFLGNLIQLAPHDPADEFLWLLQVDEVIREQPQRPRWQASWTQLEKPNTKGLITTQVSWEGGSEVVWVQDSADYFFRMPLFNRRNEFFELRREEDTQFRDTLVQRFGEGYNTATVVYQNKPCSYQITSALITILRKKPGGDAETYFLRIDLNYGC